MGLKESGLRGSIRNVSTGIGAAITIDTLEAKNIDNESATIRGEITELTNFGEDAEVFFEWGEITEGLPNTTDIQLQDTVGVFTEDLTNLSEDTTHEFQAFGSVRDVSDEGVVLTFETDSDIPAEEELHSRFDFSQEDGTLPITDLSDNDHDLDSGGYSGVSVDINGVQAGEFDGVGDVVTRDDDGSGVNDSDQPNTIALVIDCPPNDGGAVFDGGTSFDHQIGMGFDADDDEFDLQNEIAGGDAANTPSVLVAVFDGSDSFIRQDGTEVVSGSIATETLTNIALGGDSREDQRFWDGNMGEVLIYPDRRASSQIDDIENYLANKWGITL